MRILLTGSRGILGRAFLKVSSGVHQVISYEIEDMDITDERDVREKIGRVAPECVVNCAAYTDVDGSESNRDQAFSVNASGVKNLATACRDIEGLLVHISTDYIFDGLKGTPYKEDDPPNPINSYGASKLEGERVLSQILPRERYILVRSQWLYGEGGRNFVDTILSKAVEHEHLKIVDDQFGSPTWSRDLASAMCRLLDSNGRGVYHVVNAGIVNWYEFARTILESAGISCSISSQSSREVNRPAKRPPCSALDCSKYEGTTGMKLRHWSEALRDYLSQR